MLVEQAEALRFHALQRTRPVRREALAQLASTVASIEWPLQRREATQGPGMCVGVSMGRSGPFIREPPAAALKVVSLVAEAIAEHPIARALSSGHRSKQT